MPLAAGARLGPYEIVSALGAGGMGEVYRARDARLGRDVAIKVLPAGLAGDPDRLQRFEQEARAAAALNHSNILALYDIGTHPSTGSGQAGSPYLVTEFLEGTTLRDQLTSPLPVRKAIEYAVQIAQGLAAAHEKGIVHRDIKPENIFVTDDGRVKILDFGLAKLTQPEPWRADATGLPTQTPNTVQGMVLGTIGYMSPEQVRGVAADHRADIFAFGTVLYEMLSGRRAFQGETTMDTMTAIVKDHPPDLPAAERKIPPGLIRIIDRCLEKSPAARFQSTRDLAFALEALSTLSITSGAAEALVGVKEPPRGRRRTSWMMAASAITGALAATAGVLVWEGRAPASPLTGTPTRLSVTLPANRQIAFGWSPGRSLALSPDGTQIVYAGTNLDGPTDGPGGRQLHVRALGAVAARDLPGTAAAVQPFFSPDGQWVGFFTSTGDLKKVALAGGNPVPLLGKINASNYAFGTWTEDGAIIFGTPDAGAGLRRVPADGGEAVVLTTIDTAQGETAHVNPTVVPSTRAVLFVVAYGQLRNPRIEALMLDTGERRVVLENAAASLWLPSGHLLFRRNDTFLMAPFDAGRLAVTGPAVPLADDVGRDSLTIGTPQPELTVSRNGTLAYVPAITASRELGLVTRSGSFERLGPPPGSFVLPQVSPDGRSVAFVSIRGQENEVNVYDMLRGSTTSLTGDGVDTGPAWHPEGRSLAIIARRKDANAIFLRNLDGTERPLVTLPANASSFRQPSWSPDGKRLAYAVQTGSLHDIWVLTMGETPAAEPFLASTASEYSPRFSPDGRWLAYVSDESGRSEIYVTGYPQGDRFAVSTAGGNGPIWSRDGKELFFQGVLDGVPKLMAVAVTPDKDALRLPRPVPLFDLLVSGPTGVVAQYAFSVNTGVQYDVLPDGRFVMVRVATPPPAREIVVVQHWFEELKGNVPAK